MDRARIHEGIRQMRFESLLDRQEARELSQVEAAALLGIGERTFRRWRDRLRDEGPLGLADDDGYLHFCGRKKQIIVHDGSNIAPQEVEEALLDHAAVESAGVVGVHDLLHGENVRAYVTIREGATRPTAQALIEFARARVGYKAPEEIEFLAEMPLNPPARSTAPR